MVASTKDLATQEDNNDNNNGDQKVLPGKRRGQKRLQPLNMNLCIYASLLYSNYLFKSVC